MSTRRLTVGEFAQTLGLTEREARRLLAEVSLIDVDVENLDEPLTFDDVVEVARIHARDTIGKRLIELLKQE